MKPSLKKQIESRMCLCDYADYKHYLKDYFQERKGIDKDFSYKVAAEKMGFNSRGYIHQIIKGDVKKLSTSQIFKISEYLEQEDDEREYFFNLVFFNQAETIQEKEYFYSRMNDFIDPRRGQSLHKKQYAYFSKWYIPVVRELITMNSFDGSLSRLAKKVTPAITLDECQHAIEILTDLNLIDKSRTGRYFQTQVSLRTGPEVQALAWRQFIAETARLGGEAVDRFSSKDRDMSALTFGVTEEGVQLLRTKLYEWKKEVIELIPEWDDEMDRVYQLNLHLFPLTSKSEKNNKA